MVVGLRRGSARLAREALSESPPSGCAAQVVLRPVGGDGEQERSQRTPSLELVNQLWQVNEDGSAPKQLTRAGSFYTDACQAARSPRFSVSSATAMSPRKISC